MMSFEAQGGLELRPATEGHHEQASCCYYRFGPCFFYARFGSLDRTRPPPPAGSRHSRRVKEYGSEPRANSVYRRPQPGTGTLLTKSTIRVQIIVSGKGVGFGRR